VDAPRFSITPELLRLIAEATELRAWIAQAVVDVPWLPRLQSDAAARLAHSSTAIEGNPLTLPDVQALARGEEIGAPAAPRQEVLNYLAAMRWIWSGRSGEAVGERALLRLHAILTHKILPPKESGRYKTRQNRVADPNGKTVFSPPPPAQAKPMTRALLAWLNSSEAGKLHAILAAGIAHHWLVSIHPFSDGNGRAARALESWLLYTRGFDTHHLFALDEFFWADRTRYYAKIQRAREQDGDLSRWLEFVAEGVVETLRRTRTRIESLQVSSRAPRIVLTRRQEEVLRFVRDRGRARSPDLEEAFRLTRARVNQILKPLVDAELLIREGETRATSYRLP